MGELIKVATLSDIPLGTCIQVDAGDRVVAVFNVDGTIYAIGGTCTHKGGPLGEGELDGTVVTCPWHGAQFDVTTGQVVGPPAALSEPVYEVVIEGEDICLVSESAAG
ncbi:MAG: Rieske (2Fe-2S) protein [Gemmatimonadota bacterium]